MSKKATNGKGQACAECTGGIGHSVCRFGK